MNWDPTQIKEEVRVFAPATVANVACGYDVLGFALEKPGDEIILRKGAGKGLRITKISGDEGRLPIDINKNTASVAAQALLKHLKLTDLGLEMEIHKKMPFGSGLGSSAASAVAGAYAANKILGEPFSKKEVLPFAMAGEVQADGAWHADNVGPCLLGGMLLIRGNKELDLIELPIPEGLHAAVVYPHIEILTKTAREILPAEIPISTATAQMGNLGGFVAGLFTEDFELISRSLRDGIAEPYRKKLIPEFETVQKAALEAGALGFSISGAGPSVFALCQSEQIAQKVGSSVKSVFDASGLANELYLSPINQKGVALA